MKNTTAKISTHPTTKHMSHASCSHPRTPAGRASCRKLIRAGLTPEGHSHAPAEPRFPTSTVGKGKAIHLVLVPAGGVVSPLCSGGKKVIAGEPAERVVGDVTCKNCLKLH